MDTNYKIHNIFDSFFYPRLLETFKFLRAKKPHGVILIITDHIVHNDFFWELNSFLIENLPNHKRPIIPLPYNSTDDEFSTLLSKMSDGVMLIDKATFFTLTFKSKNPYYFFSDRILIHRNGEISFYAGRKF